MTNSEVQSATTKDSYLEDVFNHILHISKGDCLITDELLLKTENDNQWNVLSGLQILHEDLELYKEEFRKKTEAEYQLKTLQEKNRELTQFNHIASHDLQEPLRTIQSFVGLLEKNCQDKLDQKGTDYLQFIKSSSKRMNNLIQGLLHYSNIGKNYKIQQVDSQNIVEEVLADLSLKIKESSANIQLNNLPVLVCSKVGIRQVFQNLIGNAIKFQRKDNTIKIEVSCESSEANHIFCVQDNGIGIKEEFNKKIFEIFQQLNSRSDFKGTGLGLSLCKKVVELHRGKIWHETNANNGSSFYFSIPVMNL